MVQAAIYARISRDSEESGLGVERQRNACIEIATRKNWVVSGEYVDNDISSTRSKGRTKKRPAYEQLCAEIEAGSIGAVIAFDQDRLGRDPLEFEQFILLCERSGMDKLLTVGGDEPISFESGEGLFMARIRAAQAADEARKMSKRLKAQRRAHAEKGLPMVSGRRPFGYLADGITIAEIEARYIREAVESVIGGATLYSVAKEWNEAELKTTVGNPWTAESLKAMLLNPRNWGMRVHQGKVIGEAVWDAIFDPELGAELEACLEHRSTKVGPRPRAHLLSGLIWCEACGHRLHINSVSRPGVKRYTYYACLKTHRGCGTTAISGDRLDEFATAVLLEAVRGIDAEPTELLAENREQIAESHMALQRDEKALAQLFADYYADANGQLVRSAFLKTKDVLEQRIEQSRRQLDRLQGAKHARKAAVDMTDPTEHWETLSFEERRDLLSLFISKVTIGARVAGSNRFNPARVHIEWRY